MCVFCRYVHSYVYLFIYDIIKSCLLSYAQVQSDTNTMESLLAAASHGAASLCCLSIHAGKVRSSRFSFKLSNYLLLVCRKITRWGENQFILFWSTWILMNKNEQHSTIKHKGKYNSYLQMASNITCPKDKLTFWVLNYFCKAQNTYGTFKMNSCPFSILTFKKLILENIVN